MASLIRPDLYWGKSRSGKTTNVGLMAEYIREKYALLTRMVIAEGEGVEAIQPLIDDGTIELLTVTRDGRFLLEHLTQLVIGWWPPDATKPEQLKPTVDWSKVGAYAFESLTSICDCCMSYQTMDKSIGTAAHLQPEAKMLSTGDSTFVADGRMKWRFSGLGDYGFIQKRAEEWVKTSARLGFNGVKKIVWSALEAKGVEETKKIPCYGPDFIGNALTGKGPAWFGLMAHFSFRRRKTEVPHPTRPAEKLQVELMDYLMWLAPHVEEDDPYKLPCLAGVRLPAAASGKVPPVMEPNVKKLYQLLDKLEEEAKSARHQ